MENDNKADWDRFARLGEMIGDGLHHEEPWIARDYKKLMHALCPDIKVAETERRKAKNKALDEKMQTVLAANKCSCGGAIKQARSGSLVCYCNRCNTRYIAKTKKSK